MSVPSQSKISLVVPMRDEEDLICDLIASIKEQTRLPDEVILVDGGSLDGTVSKAADCIGGDPSFQILEIGPATPGKGRNEGIAAAGHDWIALTDAGIELPGDWLARLAECVDEEVDLIYGTYSPVLERGFDRVATFAYVSPLDRTGFRGRSIASCLLRKTVWQAAGGFPDLRAAEDLAFMEKAERLGFKYATAPEACVFWYLRPDLASTFRKFVSYSFHNVLAGRQWDWHYGIVRQYLLLVPVLLLAVLHSLWWLTLTPMWLIARALKRIAAHRYEFGIAPLLNPLLVLGVAGLILVIDAATYIGWLKARFSR